MPGTVLSTEKTEVNKTENSPPRMFPEGETDIKQVSECKEQDQVREPLGELGKWEDTDYTLGGQGQGHIFEELKTEGIGGNTHLSSQE